MWSEFIHPLSSSHPTSSLVSLSGCIHAGGGGNVGWKDIFFFPTSSILAAFAVESPPEVTPADLPPRRKRRRKVANNSAAEQQTGPQLPAVGAGACHGAGFGKTVKDLENPQMLRFGSGPRRERSELFSYSAPSEGTQTLVGVYGRGRQDPPPPPHRRFECSGFVNGVSGLDRRSPRLRRSLDGRRV